MASRKQLPATADLLPPPASIPARNSVSHAQLAAAWASAFERAGFSPIGTPILELLERHRDLPDSPAWPRPIESHAAPSTHGLVAARWLAVLRASIEHGLLQSAPNLRFHYRGPVFARDAEGITERDVVGAIVLERADDDVLLEIVETARGAMPDVLVNAVAEPGDTDTTGMRPVALRGADSIPLGAGAVLRPTSRPFGAQVSGLTWLECPLDALAGCRVTPQNAGGARFLVAYFDAGVAPESLALALRLRAAGLHAQFLHGCKNLARQLKDAERLGITHVLIIGGHEWDELGSIAIRDRSTRAETLVKPEDALAECRRIDAAYSPASRQP